MATITLETPDILAKAVEDSKVALPIILEMGLSRNAPVSLKAYQEALELLANKASDQEIIDFRFSEDIEKRLSRLLEKNRSGELSDAENLELDRLVELEERLQLLKATTLANHKCEYCLLHEHDAFKKHEPDHIIAIKHGGEDTLENLVWSCFACNRLKGTDVATYDHVTGELTRFFDPRRDVWWDHFDLADGQIIPKSSIGRAMVSIL